MAEILGTQRHAGETVSHNDDQLIDGKSGQYGVSDARRAQLSQMEQDAGVQHEAADESVSQRPTHDPDQAAHFTSQPDAARPGDKH